MEMCDLVKQNEKDTIEKMKKMNPKLSCDNKETYTCKWFNQIITAIVFLLENQTHSSFAIEMLRKGIFAKFS